MPGSKSYVAPVSLAIAIVCAGWAIYATKRADQRAASGPPSLGFPGAANAPARAGGRPAPGAPGARAPALVTTAAAKRERLAQQIEALGTARANESVDITAKVSNLVTAVRFRDGERVDRGALLVQLDNAATRADLAVAQAALTESESQFARSRELLAEKLVSRSQYEQIEAALKANRARVAAARSRLEDTVIRAPFSGRVGLRRVSVGSLVNPGTVITTLDDTSTIKLDFAVPENFLASLRPGLRLSARSPAYPERTFEGEVMSVDSRIDERTRSVTVRAMLPNPEGVLRPGMFLNVRLAKDERDAVTVPEEALVPEADKQFVFVIADGKAEKREIRIGRRAPGIVEVASGLEGGERVVVEGTQSVRDGGLVRDIALAVDGAANDRVSGSAAAAAPREARS